MATVKRVHVFSIIPRLSQLVKEKLPDVDVVEVKVKGSGKYDTGCGDEALNILKDADILLADNNLLSQIHENLPKVKWVQGTWAGVEGLVDSLRNKPKPRFPVARMVGDAFSQNMAEYVIGWIIAHERGWLQTKENQKQSDWNQVGNIGQYRSLQNVTVGVMGMGNIGKEVARTLKAFKAGVNAFTRSEPTEENKCRNVDKYWHTEDLAAFLKASDYIVNIMPSTPTTRNILDGEVLKDAKKGAVFINIGRGDVISEGDMIKSLDLGWISGAILDVFKQEPLSPESPLWRHPKIMITPHTAGISRAEDVAGTFCVNYKQYRDGQPLKYLIDWNAGY